MEENYKLAKWLNEELTEAELAEFKASTDFVIYENIKNYSSQLKVHEFDENKIFSQIMATKNEEKPVIKLSKNWFFRIAAILVISLGLTYIFTATNTQKQFALNGQKTTFLLPDQSVVVLNSGSKIDYKTWNWDSNRKLNLDGEAYFKVAKGKKFEVQTSLGTVSVLGTQFNVKVRENRFDVVCFEGRVKVNYRNKEVIITQNQNVSFANGTQLDIPGQNLTKPSWMANEITFTKNNLTEIINEINRVFNVEIKAENTNSTQLFTGTIPINLNSALKIISATYHLKTIKTSDNSYILKELNAEK